MADDKGVGEHCYKLRDSQHVDSSATGATGATDVVDAMAAATTARLQGKKDLEGKIRVEMIPPEIILGLGEIFTIGAQEYGEYNWEKGLKWQNLIGAAMRHLLKWCSGETFDRKSRKHHLLHCMANLCMLYMYQQYHMGEDDRGVARRAQRGV